jgi:cation transport ATPase
VLELQEPLRNRNDGNKVLVKPGEKVPADGTVVKLVRTAQESKSKTQDLANRAAMYLTTITLMWES